MVYGVVPSLTLAELVFSIDQLPYLLAFRETKSSAQLCDAMLWLALRTGTKARDKSLGRFIKPLGEKDNRLGFDTVNLANGHGP